MLNQITLIGRTTNEVTLSKLPNSEMSVAKFTIAVDRDYVKKDGTKDTDFIPVAVYGKAAEFASKYGAKGRLVTVTGSLRIDTVKEDDNYKTFVRVDCENLKFLDFKKNSEAE